MCQTGSSQCYCNIILQYVANVYNSSHRCDDSLPICHIGTILFNTHPSIPFQVLTPTLLPMMLSSTHPCSSLGINNQLLERGSSSLGKSPFRIVPIPSINRTQPEELPNVCCRSVVPFSCLCLSFVCLFVCLLER